MIERAFMEGEADPFEYQLAENLGGMTVLEMRDRMGNLEYHGWRAFYTWRKAMQDLENQ